MTLISWVSSATKLQMFTMLCAIFWIKRRHAAVLAMAWYGRNRDCSTGKTNHAVTEFLPCVVTELDLRWASFCGLAGAPECVVKVISGDGGCFGTGHRGVQAAWSYMVRGPWGLAGASTALLSRCLSDRVIWDSAGSCSGAIVGFRSCPPIFGRVPISVLKKPSCRFWSSCGGDGTVIRSPHLRREVPVPVGRHVKFYSVLAICMLSSHW